MKKRILAMMSTGNKKVGITILCVALMVALGLGLAACSSGSAKTMPAVGEIIQFGGHDWRVMEVDKGKAFLLSDKILFQQQYTAQNNPFGERAIGWEETDLRQYLNGEFYENTFSAEEKKQIIETTYEINDNRWYPTEYHPDIPWYSAPGVDTKDKVSLMSLEEVMKYFGDSNDSIGTKPGGRTYVSDEFDEFRIAQTLEGENLWWWLRTPGLFYSACGANFSSAGSITSFGGLGIEGELVANNSGGVRPVMWVKL